MSPTQFTTIQRAITLVCVRYDVTPSELESRSREWRLVWPRWLAIHLAHTYSRADDKMLGKIFNRGRTGIYEARRGLECEVESSCERGREVAGLHGLFKAALRGLWLLPLALGLSCLAADTGVVTLLWDPPAMIILPTVSYNVYGSPGINPATWSLITNVAATQVTLRVARQAQFFTVTTKDSSNFWGESDPCPPAVITSDPPPNPSNTRIMRGVPAVQITARVKLSSPKGI